MNNYDIKKILDFLPHRYPFLMLDRITELEYGVSGKGYKNVTANEPYFIGHFPEQPIMPGVMIIEAMAQLAGIVSFGEEKADKDIGLFAGVKEVRFRGRVIPGDKLVLEAEVKRTLGAISRVSVKAMVDGKLVASGIITFVLITE